MEIKQVNGKGRGVFALRDYAAGEIIESAPVIPFRFGQPMPEELADMFFDWTDGRKCFLCGNFQLANHSDDPNSTFDYDEPGQKIVFHARKHIRAGEEITFHYGVPLWFAPQGNGDQVALPSDAKGVVDICPDCDGDGLYDPPHVGWIEPCTNCDGTGRVSKGADAPARAALNRSEG